MTEQVPAAFAGFFDDAAVFPPGSAPLARAVRDHLWRRGTAYGPAVGNLLVTVTDADALLREARAAAMAAGIDLTADPVSAGLVVAPGELADARAAAARLASEVIVSGFELKTDPSASNAEIIGLIDAVTNADLGTAVHVELDRAQLHDGAAAAFAETPVKIKFRTGGLQAAVFPSPAELAEVIVTAVRAGVPFKLTAGLHRAVRHTNPATGFPHHGFLNIAVATALARAGADATAVGLTLASTDAADLVSAFEDLDGSWRQSFQSFGTCSVTEPAETLIELGLLPPEIIAAEAERAETQAVAG